jgi:hypothetical protein
MRGKTQVAVSYANDKVKVVEAVAREGGLAVKEVLTFSESDFPLYLKRTRADEFFVACDFPDIIHEILFVPPAKNKYLGALVQREVKKRFPEVKDPSVTFHPLREQVRDGKKALEVMVYIVEKERLRDIVSTFEANEKRVSFLYPAILPIARLVHASMESQDEVLLTVIDGGATKTLLVSQNGQILFLRVIQSRDFGIDEIDQDNINMTVTYSRQTLRAEPARCVILGVKETADIENRQNKLLLPTLHLGLPPSVLLDSQTKQEDIYSAVALFLFASDLRWGNLVPAEHTAFFRKKAILKYGAAFFFCSSLALTGYSVKALAEIPGMKAQMTEIRADMARRQSVWSEWVKARDDLNAYTPLITFSNTVESSPHVVSVLRALSFLPVKDVRIRALRFSVSPEGIKVEMKGELTTGKYGDMSIIYQRLLQELKQTGALEVGSHSLEVKTRNFSIEGLLRQKGAASDG